MQQKSIQGRGKRASQGGETVVESVHLNFEMSPTISSDGVGFQKGRAGKGERGAVILTNQMSHSEERKMLFSYIKTERPGYISTFFPHVYYRN